MNCKLQFIKLFYLQELYAFCVLLQDIRKWQLSAELSPAPPRCWPMCERVNFYVSVKTFLDHRVAQFLGPPQKFWAHRWAVSKARSYVAWPEPAPDQQPRCHLRILDPTPDLLNPSLHFTRSPGCYRNIHVWEAILSAAGLQSWLHIGVPWRVKKKKPPPPKSQQNNSWLGPSPRDSDLIGIRWF